MILTWLRLGRKLHEKVEDFPIERIVERRLQWNLNAQPEEVSSLYDEEIQWIIDRCCCAKPSHAVIEWEGSVSIL